MKNALGFALGVSVCSGGLVGIASADEPVVALEPSHGHVVQVAHIYYNIATGERVVTRLVDAETEPANAGTSAPIWSSRVSNPCADAGYTTEYFVPFDEPGQYSYFPGSSLLDFGDIELDTVVDCVHIDWVTDHDDVDLNSDGVGDGVIGLGAQWTYWDADNGRQRNVSTRLPLISFLFIHLPGDLTPPEAMSQTKYSVDVDLAGGFTSSLTFEIGDSDGDLQGAAYGHNNVDTDGDGVGDGASVANLDRDFDGLLDSDLDGDGLFDWGWTVRFYQPGMGDLDGDGEVDGDIQDAKTIGVSFGAPEGVAIDNGDGTWTWEINSTTPDAGTGEEDRFAIYGPPDTNGDILYNGLFWFGGFECNSEPLPDGPGYSPAAMFEHQLFGPSGATCCPWDTNCDGVLDFFDISRIIIFIQTNDLRADFNGDGQLNFFDVSAFLGGFAVGCP